MFIALAAGSSAGAGAGAPPPAPPRAHLLVRGASLPGGAPVDVEVRDGRFVLIRAAAGPRHDAPGAAVIDARGKWIAPAVIDSHVHLAYWPVDRALAAGGVAAAVDLAAPLAALAGGHAPLRILASGPMVTAPGGYPLASWGADGYGIPCTSPAAARSAVERLHAAGARVVKIPFTAAPVLADEAVRAAVDRAHALGLKVAAHALGEGEARRAAALGADLLAHTPTEPLSAPDVDAWAGRAVISTLDAFGAGPAAVENLRRLRAAGVTVLYGTDLGNSRVAGVSTDELRLLARAGLDGAAVLAAATAVPAAYWPPFRDLGAVESGRAASFLLLGTDPVRDPLALARPLDVYLDGARIGPGAT